MRILLIDDVYILLEVPWMCWQKLLLEKGASHVYFSRCVLETTGKKNAFHGMGYMIQSSCMSIAFQL